MQNSMDVPCDWRNTGCSDGTISRLMSSAVHYEQLDDREGPCVAWRVDIDEATSCVVKQWPAQRVAIAAQQIASEVQASVIMKQMLMGVPYPTMALRIYNCVDPEGCSFMVTPYAGPSITQLRDGPWSKLPFRQLAEKCRRLAACGATTLMFLEDVPGEVGGRKLHRDIKPDNYCYDAVTDLFVLIDFGGMCSASLRDWYSMLDRRYMDPHLAALTADGVAAVNSIEGQRSHTHKTMDLYMLALTVVWLYLGKLPDTIDFMLYSDQDTEKYLAALREFSWEQCEELEGMPPEMRKWLLWALDKDPSKRPQSADVALEHPWLAEEAELVQEAALAALTNWDTLHAALEDSMFPAVRKQ